MKQVIYTSYGNSEVLEIQNNPKPSIKRKKSLLIKVHYSSLNAVDWKNRKGNLRIFSGLLKPRTKQGFDVVGTIEQKTDDINDFEIGDKVVVLLGNFEGGALSEFIRVHPKNVVKVPDRLPLKTIGGLPMAGTTAWLALLKNGQLKKGDKVLINGGSSGVGHLAIQISKAYGAEVTSISSTKNLAFCKALGANHVISYQKENFLKSSQKYDIIFDVVFNQSLKKTKHLLTKNGTYIGTTPSPTMIKELLWSKQAKFVAVEPHKQALTDLIKLMEEQKLEVKIDQEFELENIVEAHRYMEQSRTVGKVIIKI
ncbi:NAD(P)-dependent alcohol dehydrogenase [Flammeovirga aprica]|uniref:NAD(P)-dependent alcohol dehydrogenase n=1 Tax=Flammeovirga aprica JL-4 TaxID=694437 RepID=A0A7X9RYH4_9BACT|nr:NAD(P)-dependent alcohol dehydrogenase [Flammeovirga aprica]NME71056.1 NAD(P)-dependent alcohol dehydrogenase [Flammeovirga aprica JL-4]